MSLRIQFEKDVNAGASTDPLIELGTTGLDVQGGEIHEEFLPPLQGPKGAELYKQMRDNDAVVGSMLFAIEMLIRQVEWRVVPGGESSQDDEAAEFLTSNLADMSDTWEDTLAAILSFLTFGYSVVEPVYKQRNGPTDDIATFSQFDDGRIGWRKLPQRAQETIDRWEFDDLSGELCGLTQIAQPDFRPRPIPVERFLLFRTTTIKGNPEGRSILRNAYRSYYFKRRVEEIEGIGVERDLAGLPVAFVPPSVLDRNAGAAERGLRSQLELLVRNVKRDQKEGMLFPLAYDKDGRQTYDFKLLSTGGRRQFDTNAIIGRYDTRIAQTVLADFVMLGHEQVGSFALAESKTNLFAVALGAWLDSIEDIFNRKAIPPLFALNTFAVDQPPTLKHGDIENRDLGSLGDLLLKLAQAGMPLIPDAELERAVRLTAGLPDAPDELAPTLLPADAAPAAAGGELDPAAVAAAALRGEPMPAGPSVLLNGAQVQSVTDIIAQVAAGLVPKVSAVALLQQAFQFSRETAEAIINPIEPASREQLEIALRRGTLSMHDSTDGS